MTIEQANTIIRQQIKVAAVVELKPGTWGYTPTLLGRRVYASNNGTDIFTVYMLPQAGNRVVGISRRLALPLPALTEEEASKVLTDKYGTPSAAGYGGLYWTDDLEALGPPSSPCRNIDEDIQTRGYIYTEAKLDAMRGYGGRTKGADNSVNPDGIGMTGGAMLHAFLSNSTTGVKDVRSCPTTLFARLSLSDPEDPTLRLTLVDGGWVASLIETEQLTKSGGTVEAVKSLSDGAH